MNSDGRLIRRRTGGDGTHVAVAWRRLALPATHNLRDLHDAVEKARGRPIRVVSAAESLWQAFHDPDPHLAVEQRGMPSGMWLERPDADYVFHRPGSDLEVALIICHEFGHMVLGHTPAVTVGNQRLHHRTFYGDSRERDAELFGTYAVQRCSAFTIPTQRTAANSAVLRRLKATLETPT